MVKTWTDVGVFSVLLSPVCPGWTAELLCQVSSSAASAQLRGGTPPLSAGVCILPGTFSDSKHAQSLPSAPGCHLHLRSRRQSKHRWSSCTTSPSPFQFPFLPVWTRTVRTSGMKSFSIVNTGQSGEVLGWAELTSITIKMDSLKTTVSVRVCCLSTAVHKKGGFTQTPPTSFPETFTFKEHQHRCRYYSVGPAGAGYILVFNNKKERLFFSVKNCVAVLSHSLTFYYILPHSIILYVVLSVVNGQHRC